MKMDYSNHIMITHNYLDILMYYIQLIVYSSQLHHISFRHVLV